MRIRVLTGKRRDRPSESKRYVKRMIDAGIHLGVALYEDFREVVLSIRIERAVELQDLACTQNMR